MARSLWLPPTGTTFRIHLVLGVLNPIPFPIERRRGESRTAGPTSEAVGKGQQFLQFDWQFVWPRRGSGRQGRITEGADGTTCPETITA
eukprot:4908621-Pyramimonas_sp.AAC.1